MTSCLKFNIHRDLFGFIFAAAADFVFGDIFRAVGFLILADFGFSVDFIFSGARDFVFDLETVTLSTEFDLVTAADFVLTLVLGMTFFFGLILESFLFRVTNSEACLTIISSLPLFVNQVLIFLSVHLLAGHILFNLIQNHLKHSYNS